MSSNVNQFKPLLASFPTAWAVLRAKPLRAVLSLLGVYVGTLAVLFVLCLHEGSQRQIKQAFDVGGARVMLIMPTFDPATGRSGILSAQDLERLRALPGVLKVQPRLSANWPARTDSGPRTLRVQGVDEDFFALYRIPRQAGRLFLAEEIKSRRPVGILSAKGKQNLFPLGDAVGKTVRVKDLSLEVIGVVEWSLLAGERSAISDTPDLFVPVTRMNVPGVSIPMIEVRWPAAMEEQAGIQAIEQALTQGDAARKKRLSIQPLAWSHRGALAQNAELVRTLLLVAFISLLVGGFGIANVILISVMERTTEVGLRKALGATSRHILVQFLVEGITLSGLGGLLAGATALAVTFLWPLVIQAPSELAIPPVLFPICVFAAVLLGALAAAYPAVRASALSPADALRVN